MQPRMAEPFLLVQLSDPHVGADWGRGDPLAALDAAVAAVGELRPRPAAVLVSGDLADHATDAEYAQVGAALDRLGAPVFVLPGNHDDRAALRRRFEVPGAGDEPVEYAADLGALRLVVLDTICPGEDGGDLDRRALDRLDAELAAAPGTPTVVAMHHPPLVTGVPVFDAAALAAPARHGLAAVVERHPQVRRLVAGHVHRPVTAELAGRTVVAVPSTYVQLRLDFSAQGFEVSDEPPGFGLHAMVGEELVSHVHPVGAPADDLPRL